MKPFFIFLLCFLLCILERVFNPICPVFASDDSITISQMLHQDPAASLSLLNQPKIHEKIIQRFDLHEPSEFTASFLEELSEVLKAPENQAFNEDFKRLFNKYYSAVLCASFLSNNPETLNVTQILVDQNLLDPFVELMTNIFPTIHLQIQITHNESVYLKNLFSQYKELQTEDQQTDLYFNSVHFMLDYLYKNAHFDAQLVLFSPFFKSIHPVDILKNSSSSEALDVKLKEEVQPQPWENVSAFEDSKEDLSFQIDDSISLESYRNILSFIKKELNKESLTPDEIAFWTRKTFLAILATRVASIKKEEALLGYKPEESPDPRIPFIHAILFTPSESTIIPFHFPDSVNHDIHSLQQKLHLRHPIEVIINAFYFYNEFNHVSSNNKKFGTIESRSNKIYVSYLEQVNNVLENDTVVDFQNSTAWNQLKHFIPAKSFTLFQELMEDAGYKNFDIFFINLVLPLFLKAENMPVLRIIEEKDLPEPGKKKISGKIYKKEIYTLPDWYFFDE